MMFWSYDTVLSLTRSVFLINIIHFLRRGNIIVLRYYKIRRRRRILRRLLRNIMKIQMLRLVLTMPLQHKLILIACPIRVIWRLEIPYLVSLENVLVIFHVVLLALRIFILRLKGITTLSYYLIKLLGCAHVLIHQVPWHEFLVLVLSQWRQVLPRRQWRVNDTKLINSSDCLAGHAQILIADWTSVASLLWLQEVLILCLIWTE